MKVIERRKQLFIIILQDADCYIILTIIKFDFFFQ